MRWDSPDHLSWRASFRGQEGLLARDYLRRENGFYAPDYHIRLPKRLPLIGSIGTPTTLGSSNTITGTTQNIITTTGTVPVGNLVVVAAVSAASVFEGVSSISDGTNTYTAAVSQAFGTGSLDDLALYYNYYTSSLASSSSITVTWAGTVTSAVAVAVQVSGLLPSSEFDSAAGGSTSGTSTTPSLATGTLAQASEIVFGALGWNSATTANYTENSPFTNLYNNVVNTPARVSLGYDIVKVTAPVTYAPTLSASSPFGIIVAPFKANDDSGSDLRIYRLNWPQNRQRWA